MFYYPCSQYLDVLPIDTVVISNKWTNEGLEYLGTVQPMKLSRIELFLDDYKPLLTNKGLSPIRGPLLEMDFAECLSLVCIVSSKDCRRNCRNQSDC